jgi:hypothetical protein
MHIKTPAERAVGEKQQTDGAAEFFHTSVLLIWLAVGGWRLAVGSWQLAVKCNRQIKRKSVMDIYY